MPSSLDALRTQILNAEPVLKKLDVEMEKIQFDPRVPASVDAASEKVESLIDELLAGFKNNPVLAPLADELKSQYLEGVQEQVTAAMEELC